MGKYIFQRVIIGFCILILVIGLSGIFIPGFYTTRYTDCHVQKNIEAIHNNVDNGTCNNKGRYVRFTYVDRDGVKREKTDFWHYRNSLDKSCKKSYYNLVEHHEYNDVNGWTIGIICVLFLISLFIAGNVCIDEMDLERDYYISDKKDIAKLRLFIFYTWHLFLGYSDKYLDVLYDREMEHINDAGSYSFKILPYSKMSKLLQQIIDQYNNDEENSKIRITDTHT